MPALSSTMTEGKIVQWLKAVGDRISQGDSVMVVESDKADMDVESFEDGYLAAILVPEGGVAGVGATVAIIASTVEGVKAIQERGVDTVVSGGGSSSSPAAVVESSTAPAAPVSAASTSKPLVPHTEISMPALSSTMTEGKIVVWTKNVGDKVSAGDTVMVVESDKADMDVEAFEDGILAAIVTGEGETARVGSAVGLLASKPEDVPALQAYAALLKSGGVAPSTPVQSEGAPISAPVAPPAAQFTNTGRVVASGYAKKIAAETGVNLQHVQGSGPAGRITASDVQSAISPTEFAHVPASGVLAATPSARALAKQHNVKLETIKGTGNFGRVTQDDVRAALGLPLMKKEAPKAAAAAGSSATSAAVKTPVDTKTAQAPSDGVVPMDGMQKAVVKNMMATLSVPIFRVSRAIVTDKFDELYKELKPKGVTVSAMLAKAVAIVLEKHPVVNAKYDAANGGGIKYSKDVNVAMAVAIEGGLITPTIHKANEQDLFSISKSWKALVKKAQEKKLTTNEYTGGTFTISNLGMFGVNQFDAILPPDTGSILAIASSTPTVVQLPSGFLGVQKQMTVTITCDHRHIYGAHAAEFLKDLADLIENNPTQLVMG